MNDKQEQILAKKIINILGKQPEISNDIAFRLEKSREKAIFSRKENFHIQNKNTLAITPDPFNVSVVWLGMIAMAIIFALTQMNGSIGASLNDENDYRMTPDRIQYHMNAETVNLDFLQAEENQP